MSSELFNTCESCGRKILQDGATYVLEAAWDRNGAHPAETDLLGWVQMKKPPSYVDTLVDRILRYCERGKLVQPEQLNQLNENLWEFKGGVLRMVFYYADGACGRPTIRATHVFKKGTPHAPRKEISRGLAIARHDASRTEGDRTGNSGG